METTFFAGATFASGSFYFIPTISYQWGECGCKKLEIVIGNLHLGVGVICLRNLMEMEIQDNETQN